MGSWSLRLHAAGVLSLVVRGQHSRDLPGLVGQGAAAEAAADGWQLANSDGEGLLLAMRRAGLL